MVSYSLTLRGGSAYTATQVVSGNQNLHCRHAVLTSVVVQLAAAATDVLGVSLKFPPSVCPPSATHHAGPAREKTASNRLEVHFSQDQKSFFYKPNMIMHDMTFLSHYDVVMYDIGSPHTELTTAQVLNIHSITLNFSCAVDSILT